MRRDDETENRRGCRKPLNIILATCLIIAWSGVLKAQTSGQEVLRKLARYLLQTKVVKVEQPSFEIKGTTLYYYLGDVILIDTTPSSTNNSNDLSGSDPIFILLEDQLRIELLRSHYTSPEHRTEAFIEPQLQEAEKLISRGLAEIDNHTGTKEQLNEKLNEVGESIKKILEKAVDDFARAKSLDAFKARRKVLAASYKVAFMTEPQGGAIFYVDEFDWRAAKKVNGTPGWAEWAQTKPSTMNAGTYRFKVVWVDANNNRTESERTIEIKSEGTLVFRKITVQP